MSEQEVIDLMESSQTEKEWNNNCDVVKSACNGYPDFWWGAIKTSGLADKVMARWDSDSNLRVTSM